MHRMRVLPVAAALVVLAHGSIGYAQLRDVEAEGAFEVFITQWNTADDANLRPRVAGL